MAVKLHLSVASHLGLGSCPSLCYFVLPLAPHSRNAYWLIVLTMVFAVEAPCRRATPPPSRGLTWPGRHGPLSAKLRPPLGSPRHPVARPRLQLAPASLHRPEIELLRRPLFFKSRPGTLASNSRIVRGFSVNRRLM